MKTVSFYSLGCRVNQYEIQALRESFIKKGYAAVPFGKTADFCVVNTCAVTLESERKSRNILSRAAKNAAHVAVIGCYGELCRKREHLPENVFFCGGNADKGKIAEICETLANSKGRNEKPAALPGAEDKSRYENLKIATISSRPQDRYRAYVKIQDGCNRNCSYCIIPKLRGKSRSRREEDIIDEIRRLAALGVSEIIFTGIEVSDYGARGLCSLIEETEKIPGIRRIRIGSLNPGAVTMELVDVIGKSGKFCRHLHLSVQSASERILHLMRRPYSAAKLQKTVDALFAKIPEICLGADIITSFPTESEDEFNETLDFIKKNRFVHVHAFPFSPRPYTDAAKLDQTVSDATKRRRNAVMIAAADQNKENAACALMGKNVEVLVEKNTKGTAYGHTGGFMEAVIPASSRKNGEYALCTVTKYNRDKKLLVCEEAET